MRGVEMKDPTLMHEQIQILNDILAFADDTLIYAESLFEIRRSIAGLTIEI